MYRNIMSKQLVFAYIHQHRCIAGMSLNFLPAIRIEYDRESKVLSIETLSFPKDFFPEAVPSVTAIVGMNGTGKSTALRWILERLVKGYACERLGGIIVLKEFDCNLNREVLRIYHDIVISEVRNLSEYDVDQKDVNDWKDREINNTLAIPLVFNSVHFDILRDDNPGDFEWSGETNISDSFLLVNDLKTYANADTAHHVRPIREYFTAYEIQNSLRICLLILDPLFHGIDSSSHDIGSGLDVKLPTYVYLSPNTSAERNVRRRHAELEERLSNHDSEEMTSLYEDMRQEHEYFSNILELNRVVDHAGGNKTTLTEVLDGFLRGSLMSFFYNLYNLKFDGFYYELKKEILIGIKKDYRLSVSSPLEWANHIVNDGVVGKCMDKYQKSEHVGFFIMHCEDFFLALVDCLRYLTEDVLWRGNVPYISRESVVSDPKKKKKLVRIMKSSAFLTERFFDLHYSYDLKAPSRLSSGELSLLNLFSRIRNAWIGDADVASAPGHHSILILDEAEVGFHPEWQRRFIRRLINFMSVLVPPSHPVQIIYTTHSPITLSDMPTQCVNFLKEIKKEKESDTVTISLKKDLPQTFGANVFDLYGDSFFMENGLIGEFAVGKIEEISSEIENYINNHTFPDDLNLKKLKDKIDMIGDTRIKSFLYSRLERIDPRIEIRMLEERLALLKRVSYDID